MTLRINVNRSGVEREPSPPLVFESQLVPRYLHLKLNPRAQTILLSRLLDEEPKRSQRLIQELEQEVWNERPKPHPPEMSAAAVEPIVSRLYMGQPRRLHTKCLAKPNPLTTARTFCPSSAVIGPQRAPWVTTGCSPAEWKSIVPLPEYIPDADPHLRHFWQRHRKRHALPSLSKTRTFEFEST